MKFSDLNEEDKKIWEVLENFDFSQAKKASFKVKLMEAILGKIGNCKGCIYYAPESCECSVLKTKTSPGDRCSYFEKAEEEDKPAFQIMNEEHEEGERLKSVEATILKYKRARKSKEINLGGDFG